MALNPCGSFLYPKKAHRHVLLFFAIKQLHQGRAHIHIHTHKKKEKNLSFNTHEHPGEYSGTNPKSVVGCWNGGGTAQESNLCYLGGFTWTTFGLQDSLSCVQAVVTPETAWYDLHILTLVNVLFLQNRVAACKLPAGSGPWPDIMHDKYCGMGLLKLLTWTCPTEKQCSKGKPLLACFFSSFDSGISETLYTLCSCWPQGQLFHKWGTQLVLVLLGLGP